MTKVTCRLTAYRMGSTRWSYSVWTTFHFLCCVMVCWTSCM